MRRPIRLFLHPFPSHPPPSQILPRPLRQPREPQLAPRVLKRGAQLGLDLARRGVHGRGRLAVLEEQLPLLREPRGQVGAPGEEEDLGLPGVLGWSMWSAELR